MSLEERLRAAAQATETMWDDPAETRVRLAHLYERLAREALSDARVLGEQEHPGTHPDPRWFSVAEAATIMQVSRMTVYRLISSGHLTHSRDNNVTLVPEEALHEYIRDAHAVERDTHAAAAIAESQLRSSPIFMTVAETAVILQISKMTVYRRVHEGELPAVRVGRSFRIPRQAVEEELRSSVQHTGPPTDQR